MVVVGEVRRQVKTAIINGDFLKRTLLVQFVRDNELIVNE